jgi:type IX secretion system PorP/SprF family membrane protein
MCCLAVTAWAQDLHFSQFSTTPTYINPALTGKFNGDLRATLNHRTQWKSVTIPYQTFAAAVDFSSLGMAKYLGTGLSVYYDKAGDSRLTTFKADISASYKFNLSYDRRHSMALGLQGGLKNVTIDYSALRFDNQYNGTVYDPSRVTGESFNYDRVFGASFSTGLMYLYSDQKKVILAGIGIHNLVRTNLSYFETGESPLNTRFTAHFGAEIAAGEEYVITPALFYGRQGVIYEFIVGSQLKKILIDDRIYRAVSFGAYYRNQDAGFLTANIEVNDYNLGFSYDFNTSGLRKASNYRGAYEISLIYIYSRQKSGSRRFKTCPVFI